MNKDLIDSAINKLELLNIVLHEGKLIRDDHDPLAYPINISQESMLNVKTEEVSYEQQDKKTLNVFRTFVSFGIRAIDDESKLSDDESTLSDDGEILFTIEATFRVDYLLNKSLTNDEADEFSKFNSVHNAWPFWRQYVFQTTKSADLPQLNIPLMRGIKETKNIKEIKK